MLLITAAYFVYLLVIFFVVTGAMGVILGLHFYFGQTVDAILFFLYVINVLYFL